MADHEQPDYTTLTVQLLSAYVANNSVESSDLAGLIQSTRAALVGEVATPEPAAPEYVPAVSIRKSIASKDHIVSLIDGRPYKTLKRHLAAHGLNPDSYRERYGLPKSYPMVAPDYADIRRAVAQRNGLGQRPVAAPVEPAPAPVTEAPAAKPAAKRKPAAPKPSIIEAAPEAPAAAAEPATKGRKPRVAKAKAAPATKKAPVAKSSAKSAAKASPAAIAATEAPAVVAAKPADAPKSPRRKLGIKTVGSSSPARKNKTPVETPAE